MFKGLGLINAQVVHENVHVRKAFDGFRCVAGFGQIKRERFESGRGNAGANGRDGFSDARLGAAIDDNASAFSGEGFGNGETDAGG